MASNITTLVEKAKQGDADAFSTLYQMYYPKMKGICINILREDKAVVDDLVQDAFILAFVSLKDLKNTHRFSQWLTSITTNLKSLLDISMLDIVRHHRQYLKHGLPQPLLFEMRSPLLRRFWLPLS